MTTIEAARLKILNDPAAARAYWHTIVQNVSQDENAHLVMNDVLTSVMLDIIDERMRADPSYALTLSRRTIALFDALEAKNTCNTCKGTGLSGDEIHPCFACHGSGFPA